MSDDPVTPIRLSHRTKEARLERVRDRFAQAHPVPPARSRPGGALKLLAIVLGIAAAMIALVSLLA